MHLSVLGLRMHVEQEQAAHHWARWARQQVLQWQDTTDPGEWDPDRVLAEIATLSPRGGSLGS